MTNLEALTNLYVALGGSAEDIPSGATNADLINLIATVASSAIAAELPSVKSADNGKVLTVVSGKWAAAEIPTELPSVQSSDNGKVLTVVSGEWAAAEIPTT